MHGKCSQNNLLQSFIPIVGLILAWRFSFQLGTLQFLFLLLVFFYWNDIQFPFKIFKKKKKKVYFYKPKCLPKSDTQLALNKIR